MNHKITKIRRKMMTELDKDRYEHTLGVMYTAASLAMRYDEDIEKALIAGVPSASPATRRLSSVRNII